MTGELIRCARCEQEPEPREGALLTIVGGVPVCGDCLEPDERRLLAERLTEWLPPRDRSREAQEDIKRQEESDRQAHQARIEQMRKAAEARAKRLHDALGRRRYDPDDTAGGDA